MQITYGPAPSLPTLLRLGRVSNLPTVATNVLTGTVLAGGAVWSWRIGLVLLAMTLFYLGGMYLNDYCDRAIDAHERPQRPIPAGDISAAVVGIAGLGMLGLGVALLAGTQSAAAGLGAALALAILGYDAFHKRNPAAPIVMGFCRALVYGAAAAAATGIVSRDVAIAGLALLAYVAGLTYAARQESFNRVDNLWPLALLAVPMLIAWPWQASAVAVAIYAALVACMAIALYLLAVRPMPAAVPRAVGLLIAGISLLDAALLAGAGAPMPALLAALGFPATLLLHKFVPGT
jgi:4-hydroxybenzoate polyprenyltransferase